MAWQLSTNPNSIWTTIINNKYGTSLKKRKSNRSYSFRGIQKIMPLFKRFTKNIIKNGKNTNPWEDLWFQNRLRSTLIGPLPKQDVERKVDNIMRITVNTCSWNLDNKPFSLPNKIIKEFKSHPLPQFTPFRKTELSGTFQIMEFSAPRQPIITF